MTEEEFDQACRADLAYAHHVFTELNSVISPLVCDAGYVYFISDGRYTKIGFSGSHPSKRASGLQTGNAQPLKLEAYIRGAEALEFALHRYFKAQRIRGEWFDTSTPLQNLIYYASRGHWGGDT